MWYLMCYMFLICCCICMYVLILPNKHQSIINQSITTSFTKSASKLRYLASREILAYPINQTTSFELCLISRINSNLSDSNYLNGWRVLACEWKIRLTGNEFYDIFLFFFFFKWQLAPPHPLLFFLMTTPPPHTHTHTHPMMGKTL